jgi:predicted nucleotidyltransferase
MNQCSFTEQVNELKIENSMTYCKFSECSDIHLYANIFGGYHLHLDQTKQWHWFYCRKEVLQKLEELMLNGVKIPNDVISRLKKEIELNVPELIWGG